MTNYNKKHMCPVCGKHEFPKLDSQDLCPVCGWWDDLFDEEHPDEDGGENIPSLNYARENYKRYGVADKWTYDLTHGKADEPSK